MNHRLIRGILTGAMAVSPAPFIMGCQAAKENPQTTGTVAGGAAGAAAGALIGGKDNRLVGALIGGALGAGGGYLIGSDVKKNNAEHKDEAEKSVQQAQQKPATVDEVRNSTTADLNHDGFVTMDEVVAMHQAGLNDQEMIQRLKATGQVFALTDAQEQSLRNQGISQSVLDAMKSMNQAAAPAQPPPSQQRISHPQ
jgi:uncharacterized protein YcfJ